MTDIFNVYCDESCHLENDHQKDCVVVLADRRGFLLPWTAFLVTRDHTRTKLRKEYEAYWKNRPRKG